MWTISWPGFGHNAQQASATLLKIYRTTRVGAAVDVLGDVAALAIYISYVGRRSIRRVCLQNVEDTTGCTALADPLIGKSLRTPPKSGRDSDPCRPRVAVACAAVQTTRLQRSTSVCVAFTCSSFTALHADCSEISVHYCLLYGYDVYNVESNSVEFAGLHDAIRNGL